MRIKELALFILLSIGICTGCETQPSENDTYNEDETALVDSFDVRQEFQARGWSRDKRPVRYTSFRKLFNDLNDAHLSAAKAQGIAPLYSLEEAQNMGFWELAKIDSCEFYSVERLTYSIPYLTPRAKWLLMTIGKNFQDSLANRGSGGRKIILTSALRSDKSVKSLRRRNTNASENSAHRYGTTFDIAYNRYTVTDSTFTTPSDRLRLLLGEVLYDLQKEKKCYVKYEMKQGCFHITAR